jgi:hypothetical protein
MCKFKFLISECVFSLNLHDAKLFAPNQNGDVWSIFAFFNELNCSIENIWISIPSTVLVKHWL